MGNIRRDLLKNPKGKNFEKISSSFLSPLCAQTKDPVMANEVLFPLQMYPLKTNVKGGLDMQYFIHESITTGDLHKAHVKTSLKGCSVYFRCNGTQETLSSENIDAWRRLLISNFNYCS